MRDAGVRDLVVTSVNSQRPRNQSHYFALEYILVPSASRILNPNYHGRSFTLGEHRPQEITDRQQTRQAVE